MQKISDRPFCWVFVGLPAVGKSTYINDCVRGRSIKYAVISSDAYIERAARIENKTYNEVFKNHIDWAQKQFFEDIKNAISMNENIIVDRTNLTVKSRSKILNMLTSNYIKVAVVFECSADLHVKRLASRPEKVIPNDVIALMYLTFQTPTLSEGFDSITIIDCDKQKEFLI